MIELTPTVRRSSRLDALPVAIIGAGPVGLAAAANLVEQGIEFVVFEAGEAVASSMSKWRHIRLFSPWEHLIDPASQRLLEKTDWALPPAEVAPYAAQLIDDYLGPLAGLEAIASRVRLGNTVTAVTREGMDRTRSAGRDETPFELRLVRADGSVTETSARAVIDTSGTYATPNGLGSNGLEPLGMAEAGGLVGHALPDVLGAERERFAGRHTVVVGAGHSAA
ncbi:MAG: flavoprotein, partial [Microbacteriaceae bacterium]|nr:flavoprotein [Microbacteriaceae bacterium]